MPTRANSLTRIETVPFDSTAFGIDSPIQVIVPDENEIQPCYDCIPDDRAKSLAGLSDITVEIEEE